MSTITERLKDAVDQFPAIEDHPYTLFFDSLAEIERLQARVAELEAVAVSVRDDLLLRSEIDSDGTRCVNLSASKWCSFCDVIDDNNSGAFILRKQAEAVEECASAIAAYHPLHPFGDFDDYVVAGMKAVYDFVVLRSKRLRNDADKAGGGV